MRPRSRSATIAALTAGATAAVAAHVDHRVVRTPHGNDHRHAAPLDHIFVIMLENHSQSSVIGDPNAPYLTSLAHDYGMADNYYGVTHPSMPNYIASIAGDNFGIQDDNDQNVVNLDRREPRRPARGAPRQLGRLHGGPAGEQAGQLRPDRERHADPLYAKKHDPFVLFDDVKNNPARMAHVRDYTQLGADLNGRNAPQFVWITPNQCNDMHGGVYDTVAGHPETPCPYGSTKDDANDAALKQKADDFVQGAVTTIRSSQGVDPSTRRSSS